MSAADKTGHARRATTDDEQEVRERTAIDVSVVHGAILGEGEAELARHPRALAWSGLAAGISMGITLLAQGLLLAYLPQEPWAPLIYRLGYPLGFLAVILGRQQLFTENTLTTVLPVTHERTVSIFLRMLRLWAIVLTTNLLGAAAFAFAVGRIDLVPAYVRDAFLELALEATGHPFWPTLAGAVIAGWLIALLVWLLPGAAGESKVSVIVLFTYFIGLGGFAHIVAGSAEVLYGVAAGVLSWSDYWLGFFVPALLGNVVGGVVFVTMLNHGQVVAGTRS